MRIVGVFMILAVSLAACRTNPPDVGVATETTPTTPAIAAADIIIPSHAPSPSPTWPPFLQLPSAIATAVAATTTAIAGVPSSPTPTPIAQVTDVPATTTPSTAAPCVPAVPSGWTAYTVRPGDTVGRLAQCSGAPAAAIAAANCLTGALTIFAGQSLYLPPTCGGATTAAISSPESAEGSETEIPLPGPSQPGPTGEVSLEPAIVTPGNTVIINFTNFLADSWLTVTIDPINADEPPSGQGEYSVRTYAQGNGRMDLQIPAGYPPGEIDIKAATGDIVVSVTLTIVEPTVTPTPTPTAEPGTATATAEPPTETLVLTTTYTPLPIPDPATMVP